MDIRTGTILNFEISSRFIGARICINCKDIRKKALIGFRHSYIKALKFKNLRDKRNLNTSTMKSF
ncbi:hypothetical protein A9200_15750 [Maribacter hydrothermalis]|uniref:Uncharacterized protein n=1 Tax=Maribacter hydrothermalis TaxID=1836467 RepID=A0A1B7ZCC3_9FLAO|nr:hypothetical protein A9200_15750 [Maribacter hydrothermalis]